MRKYLRRTAASSRLRCLSSSTPSMSASSTRLYCEPLLRLKCFRDLSSRADAHARIVVLVASRPPAVFTFAADRISSPVHRDIVDIVDMGDLCLCMQASPVGGRGFPFPSEGGKGRASNGTASCLALECDIECLLSYFLVTAADSYPASALVSHTAPSLTCLVLPAYPRTSFLSSLPESDTPLYALPLPRSLPLPLPLPLSA
jgi:hypothetical protein